MRSNLQPTSNPVIANASRRVAGRRLIGRRIAGVSAGLIAVMAGFLAGAPHASATEFPPNPAVTAATSCTTDGGVLSVTFTNAGGLGPANFTVVINGSTKWPVTVQPNDVDIEHYPLGLNGGANVHVSASGMSDYTNSFAAPPCYSSTGSSSVACVNDVPVLTVSFTNTGLLSDQFVFELQGDPASPATYTLAPGQTQTVTRALTDGASIALNVEAPGHMATVVGSYGVAPKCAPATTIPDTTVPDTTIPATTIPATTIPATSVPDATTPTTQVASQPGLTTSTAPMAPPTTASALLPSTGSSDRLAIVALTASALGIALRVVARRAVRRG